jgi:hypothetical protein
MSKGLSQMSKYEREKAIARRLKMSEAVRGLGYWAAVDAVERMKEENKRENSS